MHDIPMSEVTSEFARCWQAAGAHIERSAGGRLDAWLRAHLNPPFLEHLSLSKSGESVNLGKPGLSVNLGKGGSTGNVGIPGTGLSYREKIGGELTTSQEHVPNQLEQNDQTGSGDWKWLYFAAVLVIVVLLAAR